MRQPIIILGQHPVRLAEDALMEPPQATVAHLEKLLDAKPRAAVITSGGLPGFFRASLCLERGISRVVLRRGMFAPAWERELAARAATWNAELFVHDDVQGYGRVKPGARVGVGVPEALSGSAATRGFGIDAPWSEKMKNAQPLDMDHDIPGLPSNLEEVAFANGDKPVLYLVVPSRNMASLQTKYAGAAFVSREIPITIESATGRRKYASTTGEPNAHVFISRDAALAQRAATLWDEGSTRHAAEIGELMGYPACCVAAFLALGERGNNAALTYTTAARSHALGAAFHPLLNSAVRHVIPCTPCSFGCTRAIAWAERIVQALPTPTATALRRALARPVLYFDESVAVVFEGARIEGATIAYTSARFLPASAPMGTDDEYTVRCLLGVLLGRSGTLRILDDAFECHTNDGIERLPRTVQNLGMLLPFVAGE